MRIEFKWTVLLAGGYLALCLAVHIGWQALWASAVVMASVLLHEAGHAVVARRLGLNVKKLGISGKGGYTVREHSSRVWIEGLTSFAGPAVSLYLAAMFALMPGKATAWVAFCNLGIAVTNLVPIAPSDGWRIWKLLSSH